MINKERALISCLTEYGKVAIAFSGGVDSTYLLQVAKEVLGENVIAITAVAPSFPESELAEAEEYCRQNGIKQFRVCPDVMNVDGFRDNPPNRCYICKKAIFTEIIACAKSQGVDIVIEGSNADDRGDYRPGIIAIKELGVRSPLQECELTKSEIRKLSAKRNLSTASKPSFACLATRFVYGEKITEEKLRKVEQSEELLKALGFEQFRVRIHGNVARIEILPSDINRFLDEDIRNKVYGSIKAYGFDYVALDLGGYRTGSMNETLSLDIIQKGKLC